VTPTSAALRDRRELARYWEVLELRAELEAQRRFTIQIAERLADASEVLSHRAEKIDKGKLKRIADEPSTFESDAR
jgi:hypothetical protein